ncbi:MAG: PrgI family protein [Candidatus Taylorbacteria bacterium]|nr:PrgI family protein [Candidatus Taylorbacteria bacterium]
MQYQVPQFIDVEDKIFGPLTLKQFIYLAGGAGLAFVVYILIGNLVLAAIPMIVVLAISAGLAFYKVYNHFPLVSIAEYAFKYYIGNKLYIWKKEEKPQPTNMDEAVKDVKNYASVMVPRISNSKLKDLVWSLNIKESLYSDRN